jgi:hypothetical protein
MREEKSRSTEKRNEDSVVGPDHVSSLSFDATELKVESPQPGLKDNNSHEYEYLKQPWITTRSMAPGYLTSHPRLPVRHLLDAAQLYLTSCRSHAHGLGSTGSARSQIIADTMYFHGSESS